MVLGNLIGTQSNGTAALANGNDGVAIDKAASGNTIGGTASGASNVISGNNSIGVYITGSGTSGNVVLGNLIGTDITGTAALGNTIEGVGIYFGATANTVGGAASGAGNVISGNGRYGVGLHGGGTSGNVVLGNLIGADVHGTAALGNGLDGVFIGSATANTVGGTAAGAANVISGNGFNGVFIINGGTTGNLVLGNKIGTDVTGTAALGNSQSGVVIGSGPTANTVGGTAAGAANVISGNGYVGVYLGATTGNVVLGNLIGTDVNGTTNLGNTKDGVGIFSGAAANTIGGTATGAGNVISGNGIDGVYLTGSGASGNVVLGNLIGTDNTGAVGLGNVSNGVAIQNGATANTVGGTAAGARNVISGSGNAGVYLNGAGTTGNAVLGNLIGTDKAGTAGLGSNYGMVINGSTSSNTVGGTATGAANVISGNRSLGMYLGRTSGNVVLGNLIGVDQAGVAALPNGGDGIILNGAGGNTIGGSVAGGNLISGNVGAGIEFSVGSVTSNTISFNFIGTNAAKTAGLHNGVGLKFSESSDIIGPGSAADPNVNTVAGNTVELQLAGGGNVLEGLSVGPAANALGLPNGTGVLVTGSGNTVGGTASGAANVISGNGADGVEISGSGASGNVVLGNLIGTDVHGTASLGNSMDGVRINSGAAANTIGGTATGAGNVISGNGINGVYLTGSGTSGNVVLGNLIGVAKNGSAGLSNLGDGVLVNQGATRNTVGGAVAGAANVISGNDGYGVLLGGAGTSGNVVLGNLIGVAKSGTVALGNSSSGVDILNGATANTVGGTTSGAANIISGNHANGGVQINNAGGNLIVGNKIGTDKSGSINLGNVGDGVSSLGGASNNTIGGTTAKMGNFIAFNAEGVVLNGATTVGDSILGNSIFSNTGPGISLGSPAGNHGQKAPASATVTGASYSATLTSANGTYRVEVFASPASGPALQGKTFLGAANVVITTGSKAFTVTGLSISAGSVVTATATNLGTHDTSAFSTATAKLGTKIVVTSSPTITQSNKAQTIRLTALVTSAEMVNAGTVTFTVVGIGSITVPVGFNGIATANFVVPANTPAGDYKIIGVYNPVGDFLGSTTANSDPNYDGVLTIEPGPTHKSKT